MRPTTPIPRLLSALLGCLLSLPALGEHLVYDAWFPEVGNGAIAAGAPATEVEVAMKRINTIDPYAVGPGSWVYEFSVPATVHLREAQAADVAGDRAKAITEYAAANAFFNAARWPALFTEARRAAYQQQLNTFIRLAELKGLPLEVVRIPYHGKEIMAHLHKPEGQPAPVILWSGGLDGWKDTAIEFKQSLLDEGFAILAVDLPGTGESQWPLDANAERFYSRAIDYLKTRDDVNGSRVAPYFGSFSGAYAIKLALRDPDVTAAVNHSGGVHLFFEPPVPRDAAGVLQLPPLTTSYGMRAFATMFAMGMRPDNGDEVLSTLSTFSLKNQGYLQPTPHQAPLLTIHGTADQLMPVEDIYLMSDAGVEQETLIYPDAPHMAWNHADDHQPKMVAFLKRHLFVP